MAQRKATPRYVICVRNRGYQASLQLRRLYRVMDDADAERRGLLRVVDESGEDYLFPADLFVAVDLPKEVEKQLARAT